MFGACAAADEPGEPSADGSAAGHGPSHGMAGSEGSADAEGLRERITLNAVDWSSEDGAPPPPLVPEREAAGDREDGSGAFRTHCLESHLLADDPLVWPDEPGRSHLHVFFGNPDVEATTTVASLAEADTTTCDGVTLNRSGYWVPALLGADGERIRFIDPLFYYKTGYHVPADTVRPPPAGLTIIAGDAMADAPQDVEVAKFRCLSWEAPEPQFSTGDPLDHVPVIPDCEQGDIVEMRLVFPQCWDGERLTAHDHASHMAYPTSATAPDVGTGSCPPSHPVAIPEISYNFGVRVTEETGPSTAWRFVTDPPDAEHGGISFHGDWMNGWDADVMDTIVRNCLNEARECMVGLLGDGTQLRPVPLEGE